MITNSGSGTFTVILTKLRMLFKKPTIVILTKIPL
jgi:hypothetical protein